MQCGIFDIRMRLIVFFNSFLCIYNNNVHTYITLLELLRIINVSLRRFTYAYRNFIIIHAYEFIYCLTIN